MSDTMYDPLDALLAPRPAAPPCLDVFDQTVKALRRQHRNRRLAGIGVLIATYAAGLFTVLACQPPREDLRVAAMRPIEPPLVEPVPPAPSGTDLEWIALDHPEAAPGLYRQAGDRHLADADPADAARCYGNALDTGKPQDLDVSSDDSWLLIAIKQARKKERNE
jgi:hypothetical protein